MQSAPLPWPWPRMCLRVDRRYQLVPRNQAGFLGGVTAIALSSGHLGVSFHVREGSGRPKLVDNMVCVVRAEVLKLEV